MILTRKENLKILTIFVLLLTSSFPASTKNKVILGQGGHRGPFLLVLSFSTVLKALLNLVQLHNSSIISFKLLKAGDIERNPGPVLSFENIISPLKKYSNSLKIFHINSQSLTKKRNQVKMLTNQLSEKCIYCFSETWLTKTDIDDTFNPDKNAFACFRFDRFSTTKTRGGGVMALIPKTLSPKIRPQLNRFDLNVFDSLWINLTLPDKTQALLNVAYCPNKKYTDSFLEQLALNIDTAVTENKKILMVGDYNINYLNHTEKVKLDTILIPYGLKVLNNDPTRTNSSQSTQIDFVISEPENFINVLTGDCPIKSDHFCNLGILKTKYEKKSSVFCKFIYDKAYYKSQEFIHTLRDADWSPVYNMSNVNEMMLSFNQILSSAIIKHAPLKKCFVRNDKSCFTLTEKWMKSSDFKPSFLNQQTIDQGKFSKLKMLKKHISTVNENNFNRFQNDLIAAEKCQRKKWLLINEIRNSKKCKPNIASLKNCFGDYVTEPKKIVNLLNYRFSQLGVFDGVSKNYQSHSSLSLQNSFQFRFISLKEMHDVIKQLNKNKPQGPSNIPAWAIKDGATVIAPHLQHIFNNCISQSNFPACLKIAQVIPLYKKDDPEEPSNYRPISITPCISKVFELLIRDQIVEHLNRNKILTNSQYGFRKKYSTTDALMYCTEFIRNEINQKRSVASAFLDLSKAFDSIDHTVLNQTG